MWNKNKDTYEYKYKKNRNYQCLPTFLSFFVCPLYKYSKREHIEYRYKNYCNNCNKSKERKIATYDALPFFFFRNLCRL